MSGHQLQAEIGEQHSRPVTEKSDSSPQVEPDQEAAIAPTSPRSVHGVRNVVDDFGEVEKFTWLSVGFLIGGVSAVLPVGKLFGLFNAKYLYIGSVLLFMIGSALCGAAPKIDAFIVGRVVAGLGGNGIYSGVLTLLSVNTDDKERPMYLGLTGLIFGIGLVCGPVVGGAFAQSSATWRWGFYLNLVVGGVFAPVYFFLLPPFDPRGSQNLRSRFQEIGYIGALLSIGTLISIIMAINFGGGLYAWNSGQVIALFVVAGILATAFSLQQSLNLLTKPSDRMFPVQFLKIKEAVLLFVLMAACNAAGYIALYYVPLYFQFTRGDDALESAVRLLPIVFMTGFSVILNGALMSKFGFYQPWYIAGSILLLAGGAMSSIITDDTPTSHIYGYEILMGVGAGCQVQAGYAVIQAIVDRSQVSYGITFMLLAQLLGIALGLSIAGAVFVNQALKGLQQVLPAVSKEQLLSAITGTSGDLFGTLPSTTRQLAQESLVVALRKVFILVYASAAVGLVVSFFLNASIFPHSSTIRMTDQKVSTATKAYQLRPESLTSTEACTLVGRSENHENGSIERNK